MVNNNLDNLNVKNTDGVPYRLDSPEYLKSKIAELEDKKSRLEITMSEQYALDSYKRKLQEAYASEAKKLQESNSVKNNTPIQEETREPVDLSLDDFNTEKPSIKVFEPKDENPDSDIQSEYMEQVMSGFKERTENYVSAPFKIENFAITDYDKGMWKIAKNNFTDKYFTDFKDLSDDEKALWKKLNNAEDRDDEDLDRFYKNTMFSFMMKDSNNEAFREIYDNRTNLTPIERDIVIANKAIAEHTNDDGSIKRGGEDIESAYKFLNEIQDTYSATVKEMLNASPEDKKEIADYMENVSQTTTPYYNEYKDTDKLAMSPEENEQLLVNFATWYKLGGERYAYDKLAEFYTNKLDENQGTLERTGNWFANFIDSAAGDIITLGGLLYGIVGSPFDDSNDNSYLENIIDNSWTRYGSRLASTQAWSPTEQKRLEELGISDNVYFDNYLDSQMGGSIGKTFFDATSQYGFTAASMALSCGLSAGFSALAKVTGKGVSNVVSGIAKGVVKGAEAEAKLVNITNAIARGTSGAEKWLNALVVPGLVGSSEGAMEALNTKDSALKTNIQNVNDKYANETANAIRTSLNNNPKGTLNLINEVLSNYNVTLPENLSEEELIASLSTSPVMQSLFLGTDRDKHYYEDLDEAEKLANSAMKMNFFANSFINGALNATLKMTLEAPRVQNALGKINPFKKTKLNASEGNVIGNVTDGFVYKVDKVKDDFIIKLMKGVKENTKEIAGEIAEEVLQGTSDAFSQAFYGSYMQSYLNDRFNPESSKSFISDFNDAFGTALIASGDYFFSKENLDVALSTALSMGVGGFTPNMNYKFKKGENLAHDWWSKDKNLMQNIGGVFENMNNYTPISWRSPIGTTINDIVTGRAVEQENKRREQMAEMYNNFFNDKDTQEKIFNVASFVSNMESFKNAISSNNEKGSRDAQYANMVNVATMLKSLEGTKYYEAVMNELNRRADLNVQDVNNPDTYTGKVISEYVSNPTTNSSNNQITTEDAFNKIQNSAKDMLNLLEEVEKTKKSVKNLYGSNLAPEMEKALIHEELMKQNAYSRYKEINEKLNNVTVENSSGTTLNSNEASFLARYGSIKEAEKTLEDYDRVDNVNEKNDGVLHSISSEILTNEEKIRLNNKKLENGNLSKEEKRTLLDDNKKLQGEIKALKSQYKQVKKSRNKLADEIASFKEILESSTVYSTGEKGTITNNRPVISANQIAKLSVNDRAALFAKDKNGKYLVKDERQLSEMMKYIESGKKSTDNDNFEAMIEDAASLYNAYTNSVALQNELLDPKNSAYMQGYMNHLKSKYVFELLKNKNKYLLNYKDKFSEFSKEVDRIYASENKQDIRAMEAVLKDDENFKRYKSMQKDLRDIMNNKLIHSETFNNLKENTTAQNMVLRAINYLVDNGMNIEKDSLDDILNAVITTVDGKMEYTEEFKKYLDDINKQYSEGIKAKAYANYEAFEPKKLRELLANIREEINNYTEARQRVESSRNASIDTNAPENNVIKQEAEEHKKKIIEGINKAKEEVKKKFNSSSAKDAIDYIYDDIISNMDDLAFKEALNKAVNDAEEDKSSKYNNEEYALLNGILKTVREVLTKNSSLSNLSQYLKVIDTFINKTTTLDSKKPGAVEEEFARRSVETSSGSNVFNSSEASIVESVYHKNNLLLNDFKVTSFINRYANQNNNPLVKVNSPCVFMYLKYYDDAYKSSMTKKEDITDEQFEEQKDNGTVITVAVKIDNINESDLSEVENSSLDKNVYFNHKDYGMIVKIDGNYYKPLSLVAATGNSSVRGSGNIYQLRNIINDNVKNNPSKEALLATGSDGNVINSSIAGFENFKIENTEEKNKKQAEKEGKEYVNKSINSLTSEPDSQMTLEEATNALIEGIDVVSDENSNTKKVIVEVPRIKRDTKNASIQLNVTAIPIGETALIINDEIQEGQLFVDELKSLNDNPEDSNNSNVVKNIMGQNSRIRGVHTLLNNVLNKLSEDPNNFIIDNNGRVLFTEDAQAFIRRELSRLSRHLYLSDSATPMLGITNNNEIVFTVLDDNTFEDVVVPTGIVLGNTNVADAANSIKGAENIFHKNTTKLTEYTTARIVRDLITKIEGTERVVRKNGKGYEAVKWQLRYDKLQKDADISDNSNKTPEEQRTAHKEARKSYIETSVKEGIIGMNSLPVSTSNGNKGVTYRDPFSGKHPDTSVQSSSVTLNPDNATSNDPTITETPSGQFNNETGEKTSSAQAKPSTKLENVLQALAKIQNAVANNELELTDDEKNYQDSNGVIYERVTQVIKGEEDEDDSFPEDNMWVLPSTTVGNAYDKLLRDFFDANTSIKKENGNWIIDGKPVHKYYGFMSQEVANKLLDKLYEIKNKPYNGKKLTFVTSDVTIGGNFIVKQGDKEVVKHVAGTVDLLAYDEDGNVYLFDIKTCRSDIESRKEKWSKQLYMYEELLKQNGIKVKSAGIIPISVNYPKPTETHYVEREGKVYMQTSKNKWIEFSQYNTEGEIKDNSATGVEEGVLNMDEYIEKNKGSLNISATDDPVLHKEISNGINESSPSVEINPNEQESIQFETVDSNEELNDAQKIQSKISALSSEVEKLKSDTEKLEKEKEEVQKEKEKLETIRTRESNITLTANGYQVPYTSTFATRKINSKDVLKTGSIIKDFNGAIYIITSLDFSKGIVHYMKGIYKENKLESIEALDDYMSVNDIIKNFEIADTDFYNIKSLEESIIKVRSKIEDTEKKISNNKRTISNIEATLNNLKEQLKNIPTETSRKVESITIQPVSQTETKEIKESKNNLNDTEKSKLTELSSNLDLGKIDLNSSEETIFKHFSDKYGSKMAVWGITDFRSLMQNLEEVSIEDLTEILKSDC